MIEKIIKLTEEDCYIILVILKQIKSELVVMEEKSIVPQPLTADKMTEIIEKFED